MNKFLTSNEPLFRLLRTIVQAVIGIVIANIDVIIGAYVLDPIWRPVIVGACMAVLSPIMAEIGKHTESSEGEEDGKSR